VNEEHVTPQLRARLQKRNGGHCAYCGNELWDSSAGAVDFFRPLDRGGTADEENALYCCVVCSHYKAHYWHETDPPHIRLLHPFNDPLPEHVSETETGEMVPRTPEGRFYIERLRLNRATLIERRRALKLLARAREIDDEIRRRFETRRDTGSTG
jgi:hypothetical protein